MATNTILSACSKIAENVDIARLRIAMREKENRLLGFQSQRDDVRLPFTRIVTMAGFVGDDLRYLERLYQVFGNIGGSKGEYPIEWLGITSTFQKDMQLRRRHFALSGDRQAFGRRHKSYVL